MPLPTENHFLISIAAQLGGRSAARLAKLLGMRVSHITLIRSLMKLPDPPVATPKVLGVDDWAIKKGLTYATILVDIENHQPLELLADRESDTLAQWLKAHPGVEIITRDRASCYAEGAKMGAPDALQVADRWHLIKNLGDALRRMLEQQNPALRATARQLAEEDQKLSADQNSDQTPEIIGPNVYLSSPTAWRAIRFGEAKKLIAAGNSLRAVARMLKLSCKTVRKYQHYAHYPAKHQPAARQSKVLPWKDLLVKAWNAGEHRHKQLWQQIKQQGFTGHASSVYRFVAQFKNPEAKKVPHLLVNELIVKNWSPSRVQFLLAKTDKDLSAGQQAFLKVFFTHCPLADAARKLALEFRMLLKEKKPELLSGWIQQAKTSGLAALKNFAQGLEGDYEAVKAAATFPWSNGPVEGHVNRLKTIKRQMYGRAGFELLRKRVLYYADTG
jgi:transposase